MGKTFALESYKRHIEAEQRFKVVYFDATMVRTNKQFIAGLMESLDCYKTGTISSQLVEMRKQVAKMNLLICIDEVSSMQGHSVTIIKDIMTAFKEADKIMMKNLEMKNMTKAYIHENDD